MCHAIFRNGLAQKQKQSHKCGEALSDKICHAVFREMIVASMSCRYEVELSTKKWWLNKVKQEVKWRSCNFTRVYGICQSPIVLNWCKAEDLILKSPSLLTYDYFPGPHGVLHRCTSFIDTLLILCSQRSWLFGVQVSWWYLNVVGHHLFPV